ncbi:MAG: hypothetical protein K0R07_1855 [Sedimentibacter sp.]|jgi:hypothetical protein|nr:hypothetical protein [Sedimentibacter sp.]
MIKNSKITKRFIKEALGSRNYFSYRADLLLYKLLLSILVLLAIFFISGDWSLSVIIAAEVFVIFTLVNKLNITRKKNEGEKKVINKMKREHFKKRIDEINPEDFEMLIGFLYEKKGCKNFVKKGKHMFLTEKEGLINCIKIYKLYDDIELEKIDVRNLITFMLQNNVKIGHLVTTGCISKEANELIEKFEDKLSIEVVDLEGLFIMMEQYGILPENEYFYNKVETEKVGDKKKLELKNNVFDNKKIFVYILAAAFFYIASTILPENNISMYFSYYFIILTVISIFYIVWVKYISEQVKN